MRKLTNTFIIFIVLTMTTSFSSDFTGETKLNNYYNKKRHVMGISINLYRVRKAEKLDELTDLQGELDRANSSKVDLYKLTGDLCMIFNNNIDPYGGTNTVPYKMIFGHHIEKSIGAREIGGFLPTSEVKQVVDWIKLNKIDTENGFSKVYDNTSKEVKKELEDWGSPDKTELYKFYVKPLVDFYLAALKDKNSIVITGE